MSSLTLQQLRNLYKDQKFFFAHYGDTLIQPAQVYIKESLSVWNDKNACIIYGMKDKLFFHGTDVKSVVIDITKHIQEAKPELSIKEIHSLLTKKPVKKKL